MRPARVDDGSSLTSTLWPDRAIVEVEQRGQDSAPNATADRRVGRRGRARACAFCQADDPGGHRPQAGVQQRKLRAEHRHRRPQDGVAPEQPRIAAARVRPAFAAAGFAAGPHQQRGRADERKLTALPSGASLVPSLATSPPPGRGPAVKPA